MVEGSKTDFAELALNGKNYLTWADDCQFHLEAMQLGKAIVRLGPNDIGLQLHEKAKAKAKATPSRAMPVPQSMLAKDVSGAGLSSTGPVHAPLRTT
jgi:hypothetical protein